MDRRDFLKNTGTLIAGATLVPHALSKDLAPSSTANPAGRLVLPMNRNWLYSSSSADGAHAKDFDDSEFEHIVIPHANLRLPWHGFDEKTYEFVSIYRRHFKLPEEARSKRVFVDFEGAMTASTVWINGTRAGEYRGGYTPFSFELTSQLDFTGENVLAVELDSNERPDLCHRLPVFPAEHSRGRPSCSPSCKTLACRGLVEGGPSRRPSNGL